MEIHQDASPSYMGYEQMYYTNVDRLKRGDKKEAISFAYNPDIDPRGVRSRIPTSLVRDNLWPKDDYVVGFKAAIEAYQLACLGLMRRLVGMVALALGEREDFFDKKTTYPIASVRCLHYPPQDPSEKQEVGLGAHTDIQLMTMIAQDPYEQPALEVLNAAGQWIMPRLEKPERFIVNLSDMMARLTNDTFQSTVHRVKNMAPGARVRYSLPFFFGLNQDELTTTLPRSVTQDKPLYQKYSEGITGYEHYNKRLQKAHHKHPSASSRVSAKLPEGMTRVDGVLVGSL